MREAHVGEGTMGGVTLAYLVQHGEKEPLPGDPGLTGTARQQARRTGRWLLGAGARAVYTSPMRRARETADCIGAVTGLAVQPDARLRERLNWDGSVPFDAFLAVWARTTRDRDWVPAGGESSRQAGRRLAEFLAGLPAAPGPVVVVTHGGVTADLLRNLLGDDAGSRFGRPVNHVALRAEDGSGLSWHPASRRPARRHLTSIAAIVTRPAV